MNQRILPLFVATAVLIGAFTGATAKAIQGEQGAGRGQRIRAALAELDLSAQQKEKIKQIMAEVRQQRQAGGNDGNKATTRQAGRPVLEKIMAVLTPAQKAKFKQIMTSGRTRPATQA